MVTNSVNSKPSSLNDWTYSYLKEKILNLEFKPGQQLHIEDFIDELEISRTPIREAFLRLANESLLDIKPRVGYFVSQMTIDDIRDLFEVREMVETWATRKAAEVLSENDLVELRKLLGESTAAVNSGILDKYLEVDIEFHGYFQKHIKNKRMLEFMESIQDLTYRERVLSLQSKENVRDTLVEHKRILEALIDRDGNQAAWLMGEHLNNVCNRLIKHLYSEVYSYGKKL